MSEAKDHKPADYRVPEDLRQDLIGRARAIKVKKGQIIVGHFDEARDVFVVEEGSAQVSLLSPDGKEAIFREIGAGELFGEYAALDGAPRSASVVATTDMRLHKLGPEQFEDWIATNSEAGLWLARLLVARISDMTERSFELATMHVTKRIDLEILRLAAREEGVGNEVTINPFPTHAELASMVGTHREAVSRELSYLRGKGIVATEGRKLTLLDLGEMRKIARV